MYEPGDNILIYAVKERDLETVKSILEEDDEVDIEYTNYKDRNALMYACDMYEGVEKKDHECTEVDLEIVSLLVKNGACLDVIDVCGDETPLSTLLYRFKDFPSCNKEANKKFINTIIEVANNTSYDYLNHQENGVEYTAFMYACSSGCVELIDHLLKLKVDTAIKHINGISALGMIRGRALLSTVERLMETYEDPKLFMDSKCAICLEDFDLNTPPEFKLLRCGHVFHKNCHDKIEKDNGCPSCRK